MIISTITIAVAMGWAFMAKIAHDLENNEPAQFGPAQFREFDRVLTDDEISQLYNDGKSILDEATLRTLENSACVARGEVGVDMHIHHQECFDQLIIKPLVVEPVMVTYTVWGHKTATRHGHN